MLARAGCQRVILQTGILRRRSTVILFSKIEAVEVVAVEIYAEREKIALRRAGGDAAADGDQIVDLTRLPAALFIVDVKREHIAVAEAKRLGIPVFAMCDTNSNPEVVDFPIPANDDAAKSVLLLMKALAEAIHDGNEERKKRKEEEREKVETTRQEEETEIA